MWQMMIAGEEVKGVSKYWHFGEMLGMKKSSLSSVDIEMADEGV